MRRSTFVAVTVLGLAGAFAGSVAAQSLSLSWGLQNEWAYHEQRPGRTDDAASMGRAGPAGARRYRTFAFSESRAEVREPWLRCIDEVMSLWPAYAGSPAARHHPLDAEPTRTAFLAHVRDRNPGCIAQFLKTAPQLYFDFVADNAAQWVLEAVEVTTLGFAEYKGGGFSEKEAWYDILLSHRPGVKTYRPEPRLAFHERGRVTLRLWSDNFYPNVGWIAPMGEFTLDIAFVFLVQGQRVEVRTGPFKIDV